VSVWASEACQRPWTAGDHDRLRAVASAAGFRAGVLTESLPLRAGHCAVLPTIGALNATTPIRITSADLDGPHWTPIRRVDIPAGRIAIDDLDPYRNCHGRPVADRLTSKNWALWQRAVSEAHRLLSSYAPDRAAEVAAGVRSIAPLRGRAAAGMSITHRDAFGGFAASLPETPAELAAIMVHELQHSKLNALLGLVRLYDPSDATEYFAPWRSDPRPLAAILHGVYAFTGVASLWHALRADPALEERATRQFSTYRVQVDRALADLATAPGLTDAGRRFVDRLAGSVSALMREPVPVEADRHAARHLNALEYTWRSRS